MAVNAFRPSDGDGGIIIDWFPTETTRPMESLDDGGIIIEWFPTETIRPMESLDDGGIIIIGGVPMEAIHPFEVLI